MRRLLPLLVLAAVLVVAGCASGEDDAPAASGTPDATGSDPATDGISQADNDLQVEVDLGDGSAPVTWTLTCVGFVEGSHPQAQAACDHLAALESPFAPLPDDVVCSQQYGGPETAQITGRWHADDVDLELSRTDGCRISQWESLGPVLPPVEGAVPD